MTKKELIQLAKHLSFNLELDRFSDSGSQGQEHVKSPFIRFRHELAPNHVTDYAVIIYEEELSPESNVYNIFEHALRTVGMYQMKESFGRLMGM